MSEAFILAGCRTPIGRFQGGLAGIPAARLGAAAVREAVSRAELPPDAVVEVIMGHVLSAGAGQAPARQAALYAGLPSSVPAMSVNKVCGSGLKAVMLAAQAVRAGDARCVVAGGMESMSRAPHLLPATRGGWKFGHRQALDSMIHDGLWCAFEDAAMGTLADYTAHSRGITRQQQDEYAAESHRRACQARASGAFRGEIVALAAPGRGGEAWISDDEGPRPETNLASLAVLAPAFEPQGTVTAGNASQLSDGAAALVVANAELAKSARSPLAARIVASAASGVPPKELFVAPVSAVEKVLQKARLSLADIDLVEINEAFAAQCLACMRPLGLDPGRTNVNGGAIALGHPIGASGARVLVTLLHALAARGLSRGLAALCLGGGNAVALVVERV